jgi:hypothetical protein
VTSVGEECKGRALWYGRAGTAASRRGGSESEPQASDSSEVAEVILVCDQATFDFLGFKLYWKCTRKGRWGMFCKTRSASLRRAIQSVYDWCRRPIGSGTSGNPRKPPRCPH